MKIAAVTWGSEQHHLTTEWTDRNATSAGIRAFTPVIREVRTMTG